MKALLASLVLCASLSLAGCAGRGLPLDVGLRIVLITLEEVNAANVAVMSDEELLQWLDDLTAASPVAAAVADAAERARVVTEAEAVARGLLPPPLVGD